MPPTEIYLCRPGQAMKDGRIVHGDIADRQEAKSDAEARLAREPGLAKIAYYHLKDDGGFRLLYSHTNPHVAAPPKKGAVADPPVRRRRPKPKPKPKGLWGRFKAWLKS